MGERQWTIFVQQLKFCGAIAPLEVTYSRSTDDSGQHGWYWQSLEEEEMPVMACMLRGAVPRTRIVLAYISPSAPNELYSVGLRVAMDRPRPQRRAGVSGATNALGVFYVDRNVSGCGVANVGAQFSAAPMAQVHPAKGGMQSAHQTGNIRNGTGAGLHPRGVGFGRAIWMLEG